MPKVLAAMMKFSKKNSDVQIMPSITGNTVVSFDGKDPNSGKTVASIMIYTTDELAKEFIRAYANADMVYMSSCNEDVNLSVCKNEEAGEKELFKLKAIDF